MTIILDVPFFKDFYGKREILIAIPETEYSSRALDYFIAKLVVVTGKMKDNDQD